MATSKRRSFTEEERSKILADVPKLGVNGAARKHYVHQSCVSRWATDAGLKREVKAGSAKPRGRRSKVAVVSAAPAASGAAAPRDGRVVRKARVARLYTPSQKAEVLEYAAAHGVTKASKKFEISRFSIYDWRGKVAKAAKGDGASPTSGPAPKDIEAQRDREILDEWHKAPGARSEPDP